MSMKDYHVSLLLRGLTDAFSAAELSCPEKVLEALMSLGVPAGEAIALLEGALKLKKLKQNNRQVASPCLHLH